MVAKSSDQSKQPSNQQIRIQFDSFVHFYLYNNASHNSGNGPGKGKDHPYQVVIFGGYRLFLHNTKKCFQYTAQDCLCQVRSHCSKTGVVQGTQDKIDRDREHNAMEYSTYQQDKENGKIWVGRIAYRYGRVMQKFGLQESRNVSL